MRTFVGAFLVGSLFTSSLWACMNDSESKPFEQKKQQEYQPSQSDLYVLHHPRRWDAMEWTSAGLGTTGIVSLAAGILLVATRRRLQTPAAGSTESTSPAPGLDEPGSDGIA